MQNNSLILKKFFEKYKAHIVGYDLLSASYDEFTKAFNNAYAAAVAEGYTGTYADWLKAMAETATGFSVFGADIYIQDTQPTASGEWVWIDTLGLDLIT